uniref:WW domain-containing protein n=1 Tax=Macrostomum lignano TaxID=282301 RepID=A0A1I8FQZ4_9PLAT
PETGAKEVEAFLAGFDVADAAAHAAAARPPQPRFDLGGGATGTASGGLFEHFEVGSMGWLAGRVDSLTDSDLEEAKLAVFKTLDMPVPPKKRGLEFFLTGVTDDMRQQLRDRLFDLDTSEVRQAAAETLGQQQKTHKVIIGCRNLELDFKHAKTASLIPSSSEHLNISTMPTAPPALLARLKRRGHRHKDGGDGRRSRRCHHAKPGAARDTAAEDGAESKEQQRGGGARDEEEREKEARPGRQRAGKKQRRPPPQRAKRIHAAPLDDEDTLTSRTDDELTRATGRERLCFKRWGRHEVQPDKRDAGQARPHRCGSRASRCRLTAYEVADPATNRFYYWNAATEQSVSWLSPGHPRAVLSERRKSCAWRSASAGRAHGAQRADQCKPSWSATGPPSRVRGRRRILPDIPPRDDDATPTIGTERRDPTTPAEAPRRSRQPAAAAAARQSAAASGTYRTTLARRHNHRRRRRSSAAVGSGARNGGGGDKRGAAVGNRWNPSAYSDAPRGGLEPRSSSLAAQFKRKPRRIFKAGARAAAAADSPAPRGGPGSRFRQPQLD